jgi:hypothetical protein
MTEALRPFAVPPDSNVPATAVDLAEHSILDHDPRAAESEVGVAQVDSPERDVDLRPLKKVARGLPENDPVRQLIEGEPDRLPRAVLAAKADSWVLLLLRAD